jgi:hypothetical protein
MEKGKTDENISATQTIGLMTKKKPLTNNRRCINEKVIILKEDTNLFY